MSAAAGWNRRKRRSDTYLVSRRSGIRTARRSQAGVIMPQVDAASISIRHSLSHFALFTN
jgi:hypothetical protein